MELRIGNNRKISFTKTFVILNLLLFSKANAFETPGLSLVSFNKLKLLELKNITNQTRKAGMSFHSYTKIDSDTMTSNDFVSRHHEYVPYPEVTEEELVREEVYYKHGPEEPLVLFPSHLLEKRNQYLYQGYENFR